MQRAIRQSPNPLCDLAGQPLAVSPARFEESSLVVEYREAFLTDDSISALPVPRESEPWGVLVHGFQGRADRQPHDDSNQDVVVFHTTLLVPSVPAAEINPQCSRVAGRFAGA